MNALTIRPIAETDDSVTLTRSDFDALMELIQDGQDQTEADSVAARLARGEGEVFPFEIAEQILDGENPVIALRRYRGLSSRQLAEATGVAQSYLSEIETGKNPGSIVAMAKLAEALKVPMEMLVRR